MCVIDRKTYYHTNGRAETVETYRRCHLAVGNRLCRHVEYRTLEAARIVESKPSSSSVSPPEDERDGYVVTENSRGKQRLARDLKRLSRSNSSARRSTMTSQGSTPLSTPSSASSPSHVEVKPEAPSPPSAASGFPFGERERTPYSSSRPRPTLTKDGTAIYSLPESLNHPRASDNESSRSSKLEKESSFSSTTAEVDDAKDPTLTEKHRRRKSVTIDPNARPGTSSSTTSTKVSSPGLSQIRPALRRDSGRADIDHKSSRKHHRSESDRLRRQERERERDRERQRQEEDDRQARIARDRMADSERRQSERERRARDTSRERRDQHRREAAEALEGGRRSDSDDTVQRGREAERRAMKHEAERKAQLDREDEMSRRYYEEQQYPRPSEPRPGYTTQPYSPSSPVSSRSPMSARAYPGAGAADNSTSMQPMPNRVHHHHPAASASIGERGADIIARERAKAAGRNLNEALGGLSLGEREAEAEEYQNRTSGGYRSGSGTGAGYGGPGLSWGRYR